MDARIGVGVYWASGAIAALGGFFRLVLERECDGRRTDAEKAARDLGEFWESGSGSRDT